MRDSIFEGDITLLVGPFRELVPWLTRRGYPTDADTATQAQAKTMEFTPTEQEARWFVWLSPDVTHDTIAHECVHLAAQILRRCDVELTRASEETYAYYVSAMFAQIVAALHRLRRRAHRRRRTKVST